MEPDKRIGKIFTAISVAILVLLALPVVVSTFYPWTKLACTEEDINLLTGHARITKYYWYIQLSQTVEETELSTILKQTPTSDDKDWVRVNTFNTGSRHSPYHKYHGTFGDIAMFTMAIEDAEYSGNKWSEDARRKAAQEMLRAIRLQSGREYSEQIRNMIDELESQAHIKPTDVPEFIPKYP